MGKPKGSKKTGGRQRGTPNKVTTDIKTWIAEILNNGRDQFEKDLKQVDARDRLKIYTGLITYILPKQQAVEMDAEIRADAKQLQMLLADAPDEYIERIADKVSNDDS